MASTNEVDASEPLLEDLHTEQNLMGSHGTGLPVDTVIGHPSVSNGIGQVNMIVPKNSGKFLPTLISTH